MSTFWMAVITFVIMGIVCIPIFLLMDKINQKTQDKIRNSETGKKEWYRELLATGKTSTNPEDMDKNGIRIILESKGYGPFFYIINDSKSGIITYDAFTKIQARRKPVISSFETVDTHYSYHPDEYVYTGFSVGGITTGKVENIGNYYESKTRFNGKRAIKCLHNLDSLDNRKIKHFLVYGMYISTSLLESAKQNPTLQNLNRGDNHFVFFHTVNISQSDIDYALKSDIVGFQEIHNKNQNNAYLTKQECHDVLDWIWAHLN